ncbi:MAG: class I SAM-dependent methyltransferase [Saprospiraceae bacterium]|nr:class I SAM-dependent methyltransferase [Saprospiraceae bacterium]
MNIKRYSFEEIMNCEMCGDATGKHRIMGQRLNGSQGFRPKKKTGISVSVKKCTKCQLIYSSPQPIPFDIQDHYGIPPENYWTPEYFNWNPGYYLSEINTLKRIKEIQPGMKALDIGAGLGKCMLSLKNAGFDAYGFEPSQPFYERAISKMGIPSEKLQLGQIEDIDYWASTFDFITFGAVLEHLHHPAACLEKAFKWLKPDGVIHIEAPSSKHLIAKIFNTYYRLAGTNYVTNISPMHSPFHLYEFGYNSFVELSKKLGYEISLHQYYVCDIYHIPKFLHWPLRKVMQWTNTGLQLTVWLKKANN